MPRCYVPRAPLPRGPNLTPDTILHGLLWVLNLAAGTLGCVRRWFRCRGVSLMIAK